jgi:hypothetical protein
MITVKLEKTIRGWLRIKRFKVLQERLALIKGVDDSFVKES